MCQMPNIWHICHTKHKKHQIPDVPNLIIFTTCKQYRCKFATVWNQNGIILIIFYSLFSLLSLHFILFSSLSPLFSLTGSLSSQPPIPSVLSFPFNLRSVWRWPLSPEVQAAWAMSLPLTAHEPSSSLSDLADLSLSLSFGGWLFWLLLVGWDLWIGVDVGYDVGFGSPLWVWDLGWVKVDEGCYGWSRSVKVAVGVCLMKW